jgi:hypothetical protein
MQIKRYDFDGVVGGMQVPDNDVVTFPVVDKDETPVVPPLSGTAAAAEADAPYTSGEDKSESLGSCTTPEESDAPSPDAETRKLLRQKKSKQRKEALNWKRAVMLEAQDFLENEGLVPKRAKKHNCNCGACLRK